MSFFRSLKKKLRRFGMKASDKVSGFVGTWTFVLLYTISMMTWIVLHLTGVLNIDGPDFIKWNLFLSYFAGTQASIVLMSSTRQSNKDRELMDDTHEVGEAILKIAKNNQKRVYSLVKQINQLEEVIDDLIDEKIEGSDDQE